MGHTGSGKTTLATEILERRDYVIMLATKPRDTSVDELRESPGNWITAPTWNPELGSLYDHIIIAPPHGSEDRNNQRQAFMTTMRAAYRQEGWALYADEGRYLTDNLKLAQEFETWWLQGRSMGLTVIFATQRPAHVPLEAYSQATHLFLWGDNDERNLKRLADIGGVNSRETQRIVSHLPKHDVLYVNTRTSEKFITNIRK